MLMRISDGVQQGGGAWPHADPGRASLIEVLSFLYRDFLISTLEIYLNVKTVQTIGTNFSVVHGNRTRHLPLERRKQ